MASIRLKTILFYCALLVANLNVITLGAGFQQTRVTAYVDGAIFDSVNVNNGFQVTSVDIDGEGREIYDNSVSTGERNFYIKDHLGSTRMVISGPTTLVEATSYQPYGTMVQLGASSESKNNIIRDKFTGKEYDNNGGSSNGTDGINLNYFGARYYDPDAGIWTSADPAQQFGNSYSYTGNDPVNAVDPNGMWSWRKFWRVAYAVVSPEYVISSFDHYGNDKQSFKESFDVTRQEWWDDGNTHGGGVSIGGGSDKVVQPVIQTPAGPTTPDNTTKDKDENWLNNFNQSAMDNPPMYNEQSDYDWAMSNGSFYGDNSYMDWYRDKYMGDKYADAGENEMSSGGSLLEHYNNWVGNFNENYAFSIEYAIGEAVMTGGSNFASPLGELLYTRAAPVISKSVFSLNNGWGLKIGKLSLFYENPNAGGGTLFSWASKNIKLRVDWDIVHGFHYHEGFGASGRIHRSLSPFNFGQEKK